jgi:hypothetical protein
MRFLMMVKAAEGQKPPQALWTRSAKAAPNLAKRDHGAHGRAHPRQAKARLSDGKLTVTDGVRGEGGRRLRDLRSEVEGVRSRRPSTSWSCRQHWPGWVGETEVRQLFDGPPDFKAFQSRRHHDRDPDAPVDHHGPPASSARVTLRVIVLAVLGR